MHAAAKAGFLEMGKDIGVEELSLYQPHQVRKKNVAYDRLQGLKDAGGLVPTVTNLRIQALAESMPASVRSEEREGTKVRVERGDASEETPA